MSRGSLATAPSFTITMLMLSTQSTQHTVATFNLPRPPSISGSTFFGIPPWIFRLKGQIECLTLRPMVCSRPHLLLTTYWRCEGLAKIVPCSLAPQTPWIATNVCLLHVSWKHCYHWKTRSRRNDISLKNWWNNSIFVTHWWNLSIDCLRLPYRPSHLLLPFVRLLFPLPPYLDLNPNSTTSLIKKSVPASSFSNTISSKNLEGRIYAPKVIFWRVWQALERSGEAKEWVRGVGEGEDLEKE